MAPDVDRKTAAGENGVARQRDLAGISPDLMEKLFAGMLPGTDRWRSDEIVTLEEDGTELLAFGLSGRRFVALFVVPLRALGGDAAFLEEWLIVHASGFRPHPQSRLIKFFRADASPRDLFDPQAWSLESPLQIFRFASVLADVVAAHATSIEPPIQQYFFQPASKQLGLLYARVAKAINASLSDCQFIPILDDIDAYAGYERV